MKILANIQNMNLTFGEKIIFKNAFLTINDNDRIGLIGLNGKGKSTLLKIINDNLVPDQSTPPFIYDKNKSLRVTYIPQDINTSDFPNLTTENFYLAFNPELKEVFEMYWLVEEKLSENYEDHKLLEEQDYLLQKINQMQGWTIAQNNENYLKHYNFNFKNDIGHLSGGECKKLSLASGLSSQSNLILWDEPTNHLDIETIEKFEDDIRSVNKAFIMISHDRYLLSNICNKIIHINNGEITSFNGNYLQYLEFLNEQELIREKQLDKLNNRHRRELAWMRQGIKARGTRSKKRVEGYENIKKDITVLKSQSKKVINLSLEHSGRKSKKLLQIQEGQFRFQNNDIFTNLNISLFKGDKVALVGHNGQGKTTLVNIITQALEVSQGEFFIADGLNINVFTQNRADLDDNKTPFEMIGDGQDFVHTPDGRSLHINAYLENFLFDSNQIRRPIYTLSGGEKNRLQLALFMKKASDLWIFDEPTNDLDIETIEVLEQILRDYKDAVIIISHDRAFLDNVVNKSWVLNNKEVETFVGGYTKIAPYLHAIEMEKQQALVKKGNKQESTQDSSGDQAQTDAVRMTNKEKNRWKKIEKEISEAEIKLEQYTVKLAGFDFSSMTESTQAEYDQCHKSQQESESKLETLYAEWDDLSNKKGQ